MERAIRALNPMLQRYGALAMRRAAAAVTVAGLVLVVRIDFTISWAGSTVDSSDRAQLLETCLVIKNLHVGFDENRFNIV